MLEKPRDKADYESQSLSRQEYITAIVHLYRGELNRATVWRVRLDNTTNWAIFTTAGLLTFSFDGRHHTHWVLLVGTLLITAFLFIEARRFRFFDVWRYRVRKIEENFYGPILRRDPVSPDQAWGTRVAEDLLHPVFKLSFKAAVRARFVRNYWPIYLALLGGWWLKISLEPVAASSLAEVQANLSSGILGWQVPVVVVALELVGILTMLLFFPRAPMSEESYWTVESEAKRGISELDA